MSGYENNLWVRKQDDSEDSEEYDWNDTNLITAYDKAISAVKRKITRRVQKELGLKDEDVEEFLSDAKSSSSTSNKRKNKRKKWSVGNSCRAVYSEDGECYEAVIVKVLDTHWCIVRFVGYENEEEVLMESLTPSLGKKAVQMQMEASNDCVKESEVDEAEDESEVEVPKVQVKRQISEETFKLIDEDEKPFKQTMRRFPMSFPASPPPPLPFSYPATRTKGSWMKRQEDLNSLLMSWYMCGYYTGLYERGQKLHDN